MRIATYNVWNENKGSGNRFDQLKTEIIYIDTDIIALQEVTPNFCQQVLDKIENYHVRYSQYPWEEEGLAILSKYPIDHCVSLFENSEYDHSRAMQVQIKTRDIKLSITNVHLPWDSILQREKQIIAIDRFIHENDADFCVLCGDFNGGMNSSVNLYLTGAQTLWGKESRPCWNELSSAYSARTGTLPTYTLDPVHNPRWLGKQAAFAPVVMDRIYIMETWNSVKLRTLRTFGTDISPKNQLAASDHYGVIAEVDFSK